MSPPLLWGLHGISTRSSALEWTWLATGPAIRPDFSAPNLPRHPAFAPRLIEQRCVQRRVVDADPPAR